MRPRASPSMPQFPAPAIAVTTSNPCGRPWKVTPRPSGVLHLDLDAILANFGAQDERTPCREALCRTELVANQRRPGSPRRPTGSRPATRPARPARARPAGARRGRFRCDGGCPPPRLSGPQRHAPSETIQISITERPAACSGNPRAPTCAGPPSGMKLGISSRRHRCARLATSRFPPVPLSIPDPACSGYPESRSHRNAAVVPYAALGSCARAQPRPCRRPGGRGHQGALARGAGRRQRLSPGHRRVGVALLAIRLSARPASRTRPSPNRRGRARQLRMATGSRGARGRRRRGAAPHAYPAGTRPARADRERRGRADHDRRCPGASSRRRR